MLSIENVLTNKGAMITTQVLLVEVINRLWKDKNWEVFDGLITEHPEVKFNGKEWHT